EDVGARLDRALVVGAAVEDEHAAAGRRRVAGVVEVGVRRPTLGRHAVQPAVAGGRARAAVAGQEELGRDRAGDRPFRLRPPGVRPHDEELYRRLVARAGAAQIGIEEAVEVGFGLDGALHRGRAEVHLTDATGEGNPGAVVPGAHDQPL